MVYEPSEEEAEERQRSADVYKTALAQLSTRNQPRPHHVNALEVDADGDLVRVLGWKIIVFCV